MTTDGNRRQQQTTHGPRKTTYQYNGFIARGQHGARRLPLMVKQAWVDGSRAVYTAIAAQPHLNGESYRRPWSLPREIR